jgi:HK97 family phage major capsid protein
LSFVTGPDNAALRPDDHGAAYFQNLQGFSVALQVSDVVMSDATKYRIPLVTGFPTAMWTAEAAEITVSDVTTKEIGVVPQKLAALTFISSEMRRDSAEQAVRVVTEGMTSDLAKKIDQALFQSIAAAPMGLEDVTGVSTVDVTGDWADLDWALEAISNAEKVNEQVTSFVANPATALALAKLKDQTGSNRTLLQSDPTMPTRRLVAGVPLWVSPEVADDVVWALPRRAVVSVLRTPAELAFSTDAAFTSDRVAVRLTQRIAFGFPHAVAISKVTANASA